MIFQFKKHKINGTVRRDAARERRIDFLKQQQKTTTTQVLKY